VEKLEDRKYHQHTDDEEWGHNADEIDNPKSQNRTDCWSHNDDDKLKNYFSVINFDGFYVFLSD
jgi:hypothetical protein